MRRQNIDQKLTDYQLEQTPGKLQSKCQIFSGENAFQISAANLIFLTLPQLKQEYQELRSRRRLLLNVLTPCIAGLRRQVTSNDDIDYAE